MFLRFKKLVPFCSLFKFPPLSGLDELCSNMQQIIKSYNANVSQNHKNIPKSKWIIQVYLQGGMFVWLWRTL